jgi:hypothetical protein
MSGSSWVFAMILKSVVLERAGMGEGSQLQVISEPEAALMYAIQTMFSMKVNETFVVCDAGEG